MSRNKKTEPERRVGWMVRLTAGPLRKVAHRVKSSCDSLSESRRRYIALGMAALLLLLLVCQVAVLLAN